MTVALITKKDGQNTNVFVLTCMNRKYSLNNSYNVAIIYWVMISQLYYICHKQGRVPYNKYHRTGCSEHNVVSVGQLVFF